MYESRRSSTLCCAMAGFYRSRGKLRALRSCRPRATIIHARTRCGRLTRSPRRRVLGRSFTSRRHAVARYGGSKNEKIAPLLVRMMMSGELPRSWPRASPTDVVRSARASNPPPATDPARALYISCVCCVLVRCRVASQATIDVSFKSNTSERDGIFGAAAVVDVIASASSGGAVDKRGALAAVPPRRRSSTRSTRSSTAAPSWPGRPPSQVTAVAAAPGQLGTRAGRWRPAAAPRGVMRRASARPLIRGARQHRDTCQV